MEKIILDVRIMLTILVALLYIFILFIYVHLVIYFENSRNYLQ